MGNNFKISRPDGERLIWKEPEAFSRDSLLKPGELSPINFESVNDFNQYISERINKKNITSTMGKAWIISDVLRKAFNIQGAKFISTRHFGGKKHPLDKGIDIPKTENVMDMLFHRPAEDIISSKYLTGGGCTDMATLFQTLAKKQGIRIENFPVTFNANMAIAGRRPTFHTLVSIKDSEDRKIKVIDPKWWTHPNLLQSGIDEGWFENGLKKVPLEGHRDIEGYQGPSIHKRGGLWVPVDELRSLPDADYNNKTRRKSVKEFIKNHNLRGN